MHAINCFRIGADALNSHRVCNNRPIVYHMFRLVHVSHTGWHLNGDLFFADRRRVDVFRIGMGLSPMVEDVKPDSEVCWLGYDSQLFRFSNILPVVCFLCHVIPARAMQDDFFKDNGPYFQNEIENVPFESRQEKKSPIRWKYDTTFAFPNDR